MTTLDLPSARVRCTHQGLGLYQIEFDHARGMVRLSLLQEQAEQLGRFLLGLPPRALGHPGDPLDAALIALRHTVTAARASAGRAEDAAPAVHAWQKRKDLE